VEGLWYPAIKGM